MNGALAAIFVIFFYIISYPHAKNFQLCGYNIRYCLMHFYTMPYEFKGKNRLIFTKRMVRLCVLYLIVLVAITLPYFLLLNNFWWIALICVIEFVFLNGIFLMCGLILQPIENCIRKMYIRKATKKLREFKGIKIAITGSFGKTSTKNFLAQMLSQSYKVCVTPKNYNTPMGLCKTALEVLQSDDEVLIVEMGARHEGDIAELMDMLLPDYGILTAVGEQHLESFGSLDNIKKTKFELCEHMSKDGIVVFDGDNEITAELFEKFEGRKILAGDEDSPIRMLSATYTPQGTTMKLLINKKEHTLTTAIVGKFMLSNIITAAAMALTLNVSENKVLKAIKNLRSSPHRLQLIENTFCTILDDSYNSNLGGVEQACECLRLFGGKKIVISPGLVEQGSKQYELNYKCGKIIGESCDEFIVMNEVNKTALSQGAIAAGLSEERLHFAVTRKEQAEILKTIQERGSVVLFENDLPDNFK